MRGRLGLEHARELVLPSHFDYQKQAILYLPPDLPDPRTPQFVARAADRIRRLLEITERSREMIFVSHLGQPLGTRIAQRHRAADSLKTSHVSLADRSAANHEDV